MSDNDERTRQGFRALHGELKDLKRRFAMLVDGSAELVGMIDALIGQNRKGAVLNHTGLATYAAKRNECVQRFADALGTTPEQIAGGLL